MPGISSSQVSGAYLEHYTDHGRRERVTLVVLPFTVGRAETNDQRLYVAAVSKHHAVFVHDAQGCLLRDLGSTNGTFVNGTRIESQLLQDGDIVHFGPVEFCYRVPPALPMAQSNEAEITATQALPRLVPVSIIQGTQRLRELMERVAVEMVYQPIVDLVTLEVVAFEALARGRHLGLPSSPAGLMRLAEECGMAVEMSQFFRRQAVSQARTLPAGKRLFLNIHPRELGDATFLPSLQSLRAERTDDRELVLEIAEASVTNVLAMSQTRDAFLKLGFEFAYDDFGAGQARLLELADIPPHFLKLDLGVIEGIETQRPRQDLVRALLAVVGTLGVQVIAEGIESEGCASTCLELGCHLGQGFHFGRPVPAPHEQGLM